MSYAFGLALGKTFKKSSVSWLSPCPVQNNMVAPEWAKGLLSVPFQDWCSLEALRITSLHFLGGNNFSYYVAKWTQKCNLIDMSGEESRMFYCFTQGLGVFFTGFSVATASYFLTVTK